MKILIVSDNHGRTGNLERVIKAQGKLDYLIHAGDAMGSEDYIEAIVDCPLVIVGGNNDYFSGLPNDEIVNLGKHKVWVTHGHGYGIYRGIDRIEAEMVSKGADIAVVGHTHVPMLKQVGERIIVNPGSISEPRQTGHRPSYALMEIDREGEVHVTICYL